MNKVIRTTLLVVVALVLLAGAFSGGVLVGSSVQLGGLSGIMSSSTGGTPSNLATTFIPFWQTWNLIHSQYLVQPVDNTKLMEGAITGMVASLDDPYSSYWTPQETKDVATSLSGSYDGIGAYVDESGAYLTIIKAIPGTPADKAGLQPGDEIIAVNGKDVSGIDPEVVRDTMVLGTAGTSVQLTIKRTGVEQPIEVTIVRAHIVIPSVTSKMLDNQIAYIQITQFGTTTAHDFHTQLGQLLAQNPNGLILDLRDDGGGLLDQAVGVASEFIPNGVVVYQEDAKGNKTPLDANSGGLATQLKIPVIVLVNGETASASEIVAGALQDTGKAKLLGVTTYGKGVVQALNPLEDGGTARLTIAQWLTPKGRTINKKGLTPDFIVQMTQADVTAGRDPQLDAAEKQILNP
jgi:carboxyl-terminal processing protease